MGIGGSENFANDSGPNSGSTRDSTRDSTRVQLGSGKMWVVQPSGCVIESQAGVRRERGASGARVRVRSLARATVARTAFKWRDSCARSVAQIALDSGRHDSAPLCSAATILFD